MIANSFYFWKPMAGKWPGERFRISSLDFRRMCSPEVFDKYIFAICGLFEKSLHHRIHPKLQLETPDASTIIIGSQWMLPNANGNTLKIHTNSYA